MRKISIKEGREHVVKFMEDAKRRQEERDKETEFWEDLDCGDNKRYFVIRKRNCSTSDDITDILGITNNEELAKGMQSVFCDYEEVNFIKSNISKDTLEVTM